MARLSAARKAAYRIGAASRERAAFVHDLLDADATLRELDEADRAFARLLALGVASTWGTLDEAIDATLKSPSQVKANVRDALRISAYELLFLGKQPHAAVDQGVQLVRFVAPRAGGVANHVLRRISERAADFPYGDPAHDDAALARSQGFPLWLAKRLIAQMGRERAALFMEASNQPAPLFVGVNACRMSDADFEQLLDDYGIQARRIRLGSDGQPIAGCYQIRDARQVGADPLAGLLRDGSLIVSDAAAQAIVELAVSGADRLGSLSEFDSSSSSGLELQGKSSSGSAPAVSLLEIGAGRGTKSVLLQSHASRMLGSQLALTCVDNLGFKAGVLRKRAELCAAHIDDIVIADARNPIRKLEGRTFDICLVDAPCSGLGTLRRHPEIRWRLAPDDIAVLASDGLAMLRQASTMVAPGGRLVYSTCTVAPEENEGVIRAFLEGEEGADFGIVPIELAGSKRLTFSTELTAGAPDAHFACIMQRQR